MPGTPDSVATGTAPDLCAQPWRDGDATNKLINSLSEDRARVIRKEDER